MFNIEGFIMREGKLVQSCIQIYTGEGKGKTTAALGCALRMLGIGGKVFFGQFIKGRVLSSEFNILNQYDKLFTYRSFGRGRFIKGHPSADDIKFAQAGLEECEKLLTFGGYDLFVLDELNGALACGIVDIQQVMGFVEFYRTHIASTKKQTELIITGRNALPELIEAADLVSEIKCVKHYYQAGVSARKGIEK